MVDSVAVMRGLTVVCALSGGTGCATLLGITDQDVVLELDELSVSTGSLQPSFDPRVTDYIVDVAFGDSDVGISTHCVDESAGLTIAGMPTLGRQLRTVPIPIGDTPISIVASSTIGTTATYTVRIRRPDVDIGFAAPSTLQTSAGMVLSVTVANFTDDSKPDLGLISLNGDVTVMVNAGATFNSLLVEPFSNTRAIAVAKLNGDGHPDLLVSAGKIWAGNGLGDGTFDTFFGQGTTTQPGSFAVGQFTADSQPDLVVVDSERLVTMFGDPSGSFAMGPLTQLGAAHNPALIFAGQIDGLPGDDLVTLDGVGRRLTIFANTTNGQGPFASLPVDLGPGAMPTALAAGDFDGDSKMDFAWLDSSADQLVVQTNFPSLTRTALPVPNPRALASGDLNGDGRVDLVVLDGDGMTVFINNGTSFDGKAFVVSPSEIMVAIGDLNGDGLGDLVFAHLNDTLTVMMGKP